MLFNSLTFLLFLALVLGLYQLLRSWSQRKLLLLVASYLFYAAWNPPFVLLLFGSSLLDWLVARRLDACEDPLRRRAWLATSLACNLGLLGYFKYGEFLLANFRDGLATFGVTYMPPEWDIVLPVGISFYTFQSISYTFDVYRREVRASWRLTDFLLYVSFFPQLGAGPIVRARDFLPQLLAPRRASADQVGWGLSLLAFGLFCKVVMADTVFAPAVDAVYAAPGAAGALDAWAAVLGFSGQIYYDFAGYSICAVGIALSFGFSLPDNFHRPYAAVGFSDFWRRWHISLSTWLRDYVYIPFGGKRHGALRTHASLMATMLLGGLWHGASWLFVLWGAIHGGLLVVERLLRNGLGWRVAPRWALPAGLLTFLVVTLAWIPFRSPDLATLRGMATALATSQPSTVLTGGIAAACLTGMVLTLAWHWRLRGTSIEALFARAPEPVRGLAIAAALLACYLCSGGDQRAFIYFQF